jgi:hypothetical protein
MELKFDANPEEYDGTSDNRENWRDPVMMAITCLKSPNGEFRPRSPKLVNNLCFSLCSFCVLLFKGMVPAYSFSLKRARYRSTIITSKKTS